MTVHGHVARCFLRSALVQIDDEVAEELVNRPRGTEVPSESSEVHIVHHVSKKDIFLCNVDAKGNLEMWTLLTCKTFGFLWMYPDTTAVIVP